MSSLQFSRLLSRFYGKRHGILLFECCPVTSGHLARHKSVRALPQLTAMVRRKHVSSATAIQMSGQQEQSGKVKPKPDKLPDVESHARKVDEYKRESGATPLLSSADRSQYTFRSHTCGQLTADNVDERVTLCGWLTFKRLNGTFMVLRDLYGVTQLYVPKELTEEIRKADSASLESVLQIVGKVVLRPVKQRRSDQRSGEIEVIVDKLTVLSTPSNLRLAYNDIDKTEEEIGMECRYLYLRSAVAQTNLRMRAVFLSNVRRFMDTHHFNDVETPTLLRRTPGGAREFPVLTKFKDSYYALAQSPQLLKQLLMVGGMDKYYQIARCYRDEGGKPDRQPEFTQLDIEMSFTTREGVMKLIEDLLKYACPKSIFKNPETPFPVMSYSDCMDKYGSDKPDTGDFLWVVDFPLFVRGEQSGQLEAAHHPFTMPTNVAEVYSNPANAVGLSYDLVYRGAEVGGGSIRIHDAELQKYVFQHVLQHDLADIDYLLNALESGCPPHGGFALGIDRFLCKLFETKSIRDVIAFPKSSDGRDLLSGAPSPLPPDAKKYYGID